MSPKKTSEPPAVSILAEFSAGAGHFLNNPLAAISGRAQLMLENETDPAKRQDLCVILNQVRRAKEMIADLRLTACPPTPEPKELNLSRFLEKVASEYRAEFASRGMACLLVCPEISLQADEAMLSVLFHALIDNSLRAIGTSGSISIRAEKKRQTVRIHFSDSGPGIAPDIEPLIFDPYYSSYPSGRGLGFGLTKARLIAQLHGGNVTLEDAKTATFLIELKDLHS